METSCHKNGYKNLERYWCAKGTERYYSTKIYYLPSTTHNHISYMDYTYGLYLWTIPVDYTYGLYLWTIPMDYTYGLYLWTIPMDYTYGLYLWTIPMDYTYGLYLWTIPRGSQL